MAIKKGKKKQVLTVGKWRVKISHMARIAPTAPGTISLKRLTSEAVPKKRSASALRGQWLVVEDVTTTAGRYATVLANLAGEEFARGDIPMEAVREAISRGLGRVAFDRLRVITDTSTEQLSSTVRLPQRTLARRTTFHADESERILRVATVFQRALEALGGLEETRRWFNTPKRSLGGRSPMEYCDTEPGAREVEHLLGRIEHGVYS